LRLLCGSFIRGPSFLAFLFSRYIVVSSLIGFLLLGKMTCLLLSVVLHLVYVFVTFYFSLMYPLIDFANASSSSSSSSCYRTIFYAVCFFFYNVNVRFSHQYFEEPDLKTFSFSFLGVFANWLSSILFT